MRAIPGATSEDEFIARWAAEGGGWGPPSGRGGAPSQQLQTHEAQYEGWAFTRNLVFLVFAKRRNLRTQSA